MRCAERQAHTVVVQRGHRHRLTTHAQRLHLRRSHLRILEHPQAEHDIVGAERLAVGKRDALAQRDGVPASRIWPVETLGQVGDGLVGLRVDAEQLRVQQGVETGGDGVQRRDRIEGPRLGPQGDAQLTRRRLG